MPSMPGRVTVTPPGLSPELVGALRDAVASLDGGAEAPMLRGAVCAVARDARARGVTPERLLVCFKGVWQSAAHPGPDRQAAVRLFDHMVTLCIREYFA